MEDRDGQTHIEMERPDFQTIRTNSISAQDGPTHIEMVHLDYETTHDNPMEVQAVVMVQYISKS